MEIYFLNTEMETLKMINYVKDILGKDVKLNLKGHMVEGSEGKIVRKYISVLGQDEMYHILKSLDKKGLTLKKIEKEFLKYIK